MVETLKVEPLSKGVMEEIGMSWHTDADGSDYIVSDLVQLSEAEAEAYKNRDTHRLLHIKIAIKIRIEVKIMEMPIYFCV